MLKNLKSRQIILLLLLLTSCQQNKTNNSANVNLESIEARNSFLETIYDSDQSLRTEFASNEYNNQEAYEYWKIASKTDSINLTKIDKYIGIFGYPDTLNYTIKANKAPWYVIQHCTKLNIRNTYYEILKEAYGDGKITDINFYLYLQRNYQFKNREMLGIENDENYTFKEKILMLQDTLGYEQ